MSNNNHAIKEKSFESLQLKDDFMFSVIMRNQKYCRPFLERILDVSISHIEYPDAQHTIDLSASSKSVRLDIFVEDGKNTVYNIEMQTGRNKNLPKRTRYYQGMIDLNSLEKGTGYKNLKQSIIIFICTFDLFGEGRHIYTFENRCIQNLYLGLGDATTKIILNTKGFMNDVGPRMKKLLNYIDGKQPEDAFTKELDAAVQSVRKNQKWRLDYMTLQMKYDEKYEQGMEQGIKQGVEQGKREGKLEGAVLTLDELGYSISEIAQRLNQREDTVLKILKSQD